MLLVKTIKQTSILCECTICPTKVAQQREKKNISPRNIRVKENTLTFLGPAFFVDLTWTDRSGLIGAAG